MSLESALRQLGKEIQQDERFVRLQAAAKANDEDKELQDKMGEMQLISLNYQQEQEKGEAADQDKLSQLQKDYESLYNEIMSMQTMVEYSGVAHEMEHMAQYISRMIGLFFDGEDPDTCELASEDACTHDCSTCGGCH